MPLQYTKEKASYHSDRRQKWDNKDTMNILPWRIYHTTKTWKKSFLEQSMMLWRTEEKESETIVGLLANHAQTLGSHKTWYQKIIWVLEDVFFHCSYTKQTS